MWLIFKAGFVAGFFNGLVVWAGNRMTDTEEEEEEEEEE